jgi:hypothetical protein
MGEDILVGSEQALLTADAESDDGRGERSVECETRQLDLASWPLTVMSVELGLCGRQIPFVKLLAQDGVILSELRTMSVASSMTCRHALRSSGFESYSI